MIPTITPVLSQFPALRRAFDQQMQQEALRLTKRAATAAKNKLRAEMGAAGLGKLSLAVGSGSDLEKSGQVRARASGWSASGWLFARSGSKRSRGALISYLDGATITPKNPSGLLWYPTEDIMRMARVPLPSSGGNSRANVRLTPKLWDRVYAARFGPLVRLRIHGKDVLIVRDATLSMAGKPRSIKPLTKRGQVPKGQVARKFVIAFIGIRATSRAKRVDVRKILQDTALDMSRGGLNLTAGI